MKHLLIIGARGYGREVYNYALKSIGYGIDFDIKGYLDDNANALDGYEGYPPILSSVEKYEIQKNDVFLCALGEVKWKQHYVQIILEKGGKESPLGGTISYTKLDSASGNYEFTDAQKGAVEQIGTSGVYRAPAKTTTNGVGACGSTSRSYVKVDCSSSGGCTYSLCLTAGSGKYYIKDATEAQLLGSETSFITNSDS